ncbi:PASTA domain-containing protein [Saccharospirillum impatiens]|uniref:PASTA domain-containing protein n=1 Tax=Saccharospirillum impatiens TaxID=169438 RepID=UPI0004187E2A|nr:PASTA domain-containing protein [Saccharospirillum impatiens]
MGKVVATVHLLTDEGKVAAGHTLSLEAYHLKNRRWQAVARTKTDAQGMATLTSAATVVSETMAPALRLTEAGSPAPRVLAHGGLTQYDTRQQTLFLDFGNIERLEETAHRLQHTDSRFARTNESVSGAPVAPQISALAMNRLVMANPTLTANLTRVDLAGERIKPQAEATGVTLDPAVTATLLNTKEIDTLKARELQLNAQLLDKSREFTLTTDKLTTATSRIGTLEANLTQTAAEKDALAKKVATLEANTRTPASIDTVLLGLGTKVSSSNDRMKSQALPYRLGNVKIDLRGSVSPDGESIVMGDSAGGVSTELISDDARTEEARVTVPAVVGLTESAARRVLRSVGLRMTTAHQQLAAGSGVPGQALSQHPAASSEAAHGSSVLVVFGESTAEAQ